MRIPFHPEAAESSNGNSYSFQRSDMVLVGLFVNVTSVSGTLPSLTVTLQHSPDGSTWYNVGSIAVTRTSTGSSMASPAALAMLADFVRIYWSVSGTLNPCFTFSADVVTKTT